MKPTNQYPKILYKPPPYQISLLPQFFYRLSIVFFEIYNQIHELLKLNTDGKGLVQSVISIFEGTLKGKKAKWARLTIEICRTWKNIKGRKNARYLAGTKGGSESSWKQAMYWFLSCYPFFEQSYP